MTVASRSRLLTLGLLGAGVVGATVAAVSLATAPAASGAPTCTITWTGATSNDWSDAGNWTPSRVPTTTDVACMAASPTRAAVSLGTSTTVRAVVFAPLASSLTITSGTLTVTEPAGTANTSAVRALSLSGSYWNGSGTVTGLTTANSGGFRNGSVTLAGTSSLQGISLDTAAALTNTGTATWNSGAGYFDVYGSSTFTNAAGGTFTATGTAPYSMYSGGSGNAFVNSGSFVVNLDPAANALQLQVPFANTGTVTGTRGTASANGGSVAATPDTGSYAMANAAVFAFGGGTRTVSTISSTGQGAIGIAGGSTSIAAGSISNLLITGGSVGAPTGAGFSVGAVNAPSTNSGTIVGPGTVTITGTGTGAATLSVLDHLFLDSGAKVVSQGASRWNSGTNYFEVYGGSTFTNSGTFTVIGTAPYSMYSGGSGNAFVNSGNLVVNLDPAANALQLQVPFANTGTVTGTKGTANANGGGVAATPDTGSYAMANAAVFAFAGGSRTVTTVSSTGEGSVGIAGGSTSIAAGSISNLLLTGGSVGAPTGAGFSVGAVNAPASGSGTIVGPGTVTITGTGTGTAALSVLDHLFLDSGAKVVSQGASRWNSGTNYFEVYGGSTFTNAGTLTVIGTAPYSMYSGGSGNAFVNSGNFVVNLDPAANTLQLQVPFANTGTVTGTKGTANANGGGVPATPDTGSYAMANAAVFAFAGGSRTVSTVSSTGQGSVGIAGGTTTIAAGSISNLLLTGGSVGAPTGAGFSVGAVNAPASGSGTIVGPGTVTITGTGAGTAALSVLDHLRLDSAANVMSQAAARWSDSNNYFEVQGGSTFTNAGTLTLVGTGSYSMYNGGSGNAFVNSGTFVSTLDAAGNAATLAVPFTNTGTFTATRGTVTLQSVTNLSTNTLTGGTWNAPTGTITIPDTVSTNASTVSIGSAGQILASTTGTAAFIPLAANSGSFTSGRNLTLTSSALTNSGTLTVSGGSLVVPSLTQSAGTTTVAAGTTLNAGTAQVRINVGTLTGSGTVRGLVSGAGTVAPGTGGAGTLTVTGTVTTTAGTTLAVTEGPSAGTTVAASGAVNVATAAIAVTTTGAPAIGTVRTVISGSSRTGAVASVTGVDVPAAGGYWAVGYTPNSVTLTLTAYPTVSVNGGAVVTEGNSGTTPATFTVTLGAASPVQAVVDYATEPGTATSGVDYAGQTDTLTFLPGETSKTVQVSVVGDTLHEADETFSLTLSNARGSSIGTGSAAATIDDDDAPPAFSVNDAQGATSAAGGGTVTFTVALDTPSGLSASVQYATVDGTAVAGPDYTATSGTVTIPAGSTSATVDVQLTTKTTYAPPKMFSLVLSNPVESTVADGSGTGTIVNGNPNGPTVASVVPGSGAQATTVPVTINGTGFTAGATVAVSGFGVTANAVTVVDPTTITASFTIVGGAPVGARSVTVTSSGLSNTCSGCFTVVAKPVVTGSDRPNLATATADVVVTVTGSNFAPGADVKLVRGTRSVLATSTTTNSATSVTALLTLPRATPVGQWNIVVVNPDGGTGSCVNCATVWAAPTVTAVSPSTLARGTTTAVTITGTGFVTGAVVSIPGAQLSNVTVVNGTTITATVRVAATAATGPRVVKVFNPTPAGNGVGALTGGVSVS